MWAGFGRGLDRAGGSPSLWTRASQGSQAWRQQRFWALESAEESGSTEQEQTHHRPGLAGQWVLKSGGQSLPVQTKWVYRTLMAFMTTRIYNVSWHRLRRKGHRPTRASTVLYFPMGSRRPKHCVVTPRVAATPWLVDGWGQGDKSLAERVCFFPGMILRPGPMNPRNSRAVSNASSPAGSATRVASRDPSGSGVWPAALKAGLSLPRAAGMARGGDEASFLQESLPPGRQVHLCRRKGGGGGGFPPPGSRTKLGTHFQGQSSCLWVTEKPGIPSTSLAHPPPSSRPFVTAPLLPWEPCQLSR